MSFSSLFKFSKVSQNYIRINQHEDAIESNYRVSNRMATRWAQRRLVSRSRTRLDRNWKHTRANTARNSCRHGWHTPIVFEPKSCRLFDSPSIESSTSRASEARAWTSTAIGLPLWSLFLLRSLFFSFFLFLLLIIIII